MKRAAREALEQLEIRRSNLGTLVWASLHGLGFAPETCSDVVDALDARGMLREAYDRLALHADVWRDERGRYQCAEPWASPTLRVLLRLQLTALSREAELLASPLEAVS